MLSQSQIDQYHRDGFLILRGVFAGDELAQLRAAADAVQAEGIELAHDGGEAKHHIYKDIDGKKTYFRSEKMWTRGDIFQAVTVKPDLLAAIGQCTGLPFLPINDSFVCKLPGGNVPIPWHQDPPYGGPRGRAETYDEPNFDVDIYLDESTPENGCVWGIPGHHLVGHVELEKYSQAELFEKFGAVPMIMQPGDVLFHSLSAPHGSVGNTTDKIRRIFYIHYMSQGVRQHVYNFWNDGSKPDFNQAGLARVREMIDARQRLGFGGIDGHDVSLTDDGFVFSGEPTTPPNHWATLKAQMSVDEIEAKRKLQPLTATTS